jgi:hypothetical protein
MSFAARASSRVKLVRDWHAPQQPVVNHLRLRQVREFGRPAHVRDGRQQVILPHRTQQRVGRNLCRPVLERREVRIVVVESVAQSDALAVLQQKK